jgi:hypothetical protein
MDSHAVGDCESNECLAHPNLIGQDDAWLRSESLEDFDRLISLAQLVGFGQSGDKP